MLGEQPGYKGDQGTGSEGASGQNRGGEGDRPRGFLVPSKNLGFFFWERLRTIGTLGGHALISILIGSYCLLCFEKQ